MLRTTRTEVYLKVCRPPLGMFGDWVSSPTSGHNDIPVVTTSLTTPQAANQHSHLSPSPSMSNCGVS